MPLRLEIKKMMTSRSDRVKSVDLHPSEPWVLVALYNGTVFIWDYEQSRSVKNFEVCTLPVRSSKFIVRKQWFCTASDDMHMRVYNYNTMEKINDWEAHTDYIRYLEVHPSLPYVLSCSDDMSIKLWDWEKGWDCTQVFEGHAHYVMMVKINLKDSNTFASASLDRSIKVWGLNAATPHFALDGHDRGVNCLDYYPGGDKPYLLSGADDKTVKVWDYQTKTCVQTLSGHHNNVSAVLFHPRLPVILSGGEDGTVRLWHSSTYRAETTLNYGMERVWALAASADSNKVAVGFDEGTVVLKLGNEVPVASLDSHTGRVVWANNSEILTASLKGLAAEANAQDGEKLPVVPKDLGGTELFPQSLKHNCNGRFLVVCGDGEYVIYTSQALRNKAFGAALDFAWSALGTGDYAIRESLSRVKTFKNFKEAHTLRPPVAAADALFGGACLGVRGSDSVVFFDWEEGVMVRKIDVAPKEVYWSEGGELLLLACEESYFVLKYDSSVVAAAIQAGAIDSEEGVEEAFELIGEVSGKVQTGQWVGACFLYTNEAGRLNYYVGGEVMTLCHLDHTMYMLGYLPKEDRVYLMDKAQGIHSFKVLQSYLQYQTAVVRKDFATANSLLPSIPVTEYTAVARFLESQGFKEEALAVSRDPDHRFDLACELGKLSTARELLDEMPIEEYDTLDSQSKWKRLGDLAMSECDLALVEKCATNSSDLSGLLLLHSSMGNAAGMTELAKAAAAAGKTNIAFLALLLCGRVEECLDLLVKAGRLPEAAFMARTYLPSEVPRLIALWKEDLKTVSVKAAEALADPKTHPGMFEDLEVALQVEAIFKGQRGTAIPAGAWPQARADLDLDLIALVKAQNESRGSSSSNQQQQLPPPPSPQQQPVAAASGSAPPPAAPAAQNGTATSGANMETASNAAATADEAENDTEDLLSDTDFAEANEGSDDINADDDIDIDDEESDSAAAAAAAAEAAAAAAAAQREQQQRAQAEEAARQTAAAAETARKQAAEAAAQKQAAAAAAAAAQQRQQQEAAAAAAAAQQQQQDAAKEAALKRIEEAKAKAMALAHARVEAAKKAADEAAAAKRQAEEAEAAAAAVAAAAVKTASTSSNGNTEPAAAPARSSKSAADGDLDDDEFGDDW